MSGQQIGGFVGGVVGAWVGGPAGAQWGFAIGSALGGYIDPEQVEGPRLSQATVQTSQVGIPIPFGWGTFPVVGNLIWAGDIIEHKRKERQGKGGPEQIIYSYTRAAAIGLCQGMLREDGLFDPMAGVVMVKRQMKVVYDARSDAELEEEFNFVPDGSSPLSSAFSNVAQFIAHQRALSSSFINKATFYLGSEDQLPDPTMEAAIGVGTVPAYPGLVYMLVDDNVDDTAGAVAQFEVILSTTGSNVTSVTGASWVASTSAANLYVPSPDGFDWSAASETNPGGVWMMYGNGVLLRYGSGATVFRRIGGTGPWETVSQANGGRGAFVAGRFWIVSGSSQVASSVLGDSWDTHAVSLFGAATIVGGNDNCIVVGDNTGRVRCSIDGGDTWGAIVNVFNGAYVTAIGSNGSRIVVGSSDKRFSYSDDNGATFTPATTPYADPGSNAGGITRIIYGNNVWVATCAHAVGDDSHSFSINGSAFVLAATAAATGGHDADYYAGLFVTVGASGLIATTVDGSAYAIQDPHELGTALLNSVVAIGCYGGTPVPDAPGWYVFPDGTLCGGVAADSHVRSPVVLGTIIAGLCRRSGLDSSEYDVSQLTDLVEGVRFANVSGADAMIIPLMQAYRFDKSEHDGRLNWIKRGGNVVASIGPDDFVEREGDALGWTRVQEAELLRKSTITYLDPRANWAQNTQTAERRTSTVQAKGEAVFEVPLCESSDAAAKMVDITLKVAWSETETVKFSLSLAWSDLCATDVTSVTDKAGKVHRLRLLSIEEDSGVLYCEASKDRQSTYTSNVQGVRPNPPRVTTPGLIGPTMVAVMDLPVMRDADDKLGLAVAVRGILPGWHGAAVYLSTDAGASGGPVANATDPSVIGFTETSLVADVSSEYPSGQTLQVWLPEAPSSVDYATLLRYNNRAALQSDSGEWEVLQYQTVTDDGDDLYTLSGIVRGRYATTPGQATEGATFVLLDSTVQFVECERWMIGADDLMVKGVSLGTDPDATPYVAFEFTTPASQTEWPPTNIAAARDGSDNVTASWAGRPRLGTETTPYHSQHFTGYRVSYSDGTDTFNYDVARSTLVTGNGIVTTMETSEHEYTAAMQTVDFGSVPAELTVSVQALNAITGAGPASEEVTV